MATSPLSDFTYYANRSFGGISPSEINDPRAQAMLATLRQYDPNAQFALTPDSNGNIGYTLQFDASKLPSASGSGTLAKGNTGGTAGGYMPSFSTVQDQMQLNDPNAVTNGTPYGTITSNTNVNDRYSPGFALAGVLGTVGFSALAPYLASAMSGGALGSGAGAAATPLDTSSDGYLGLTNGPGMPDFQGVPAAPPNGIDMGPWSGTSPADMVPGTGATGAGLTQAAAPITEAGTAARVGDVIRNGGIPGVSSLLQSASELGLTPSGLLNAARSVLGGGTPGGSGGGGSGGGLLAMQPKQPQPVDNITAILRRYYGTGLLNPGGMNG